MASGSWFQSQGCVSRTYIPCRLDDEAWRIGAYVLQTSIISHHNIPLNDFTTEKHGWSVHPPTPPHTHPATNNQTNSKKQKQQKNKNNNTHNNNNHNKQTNKQTNKQQQQNNKSQQKRIIRTTTTTTNPLHVQLIRLYCVLCSMLIVHLFLFCGFLSALVCLFCCCGWDKPNLDWMVKRQAMLVGTRQDKN